VVRIKCYAYDCKADTVVCKQYLLEIREVRILCKFAGRYYRLHDAIVLPRPQRAGGPPVLIGGNGMRRTLPLTAKYADAWNGVFLTPEAFAQRNKRLAVLLEAEGRTPANVQRSLMTGVLFGRDDAEVAAKLAPRGRTLAEYCASGGIGGTVNAIVEPLERLAKAGVQRVRLLWADMDDLDGLAALAAGVSGR
jgi:alkanesulfonate monooxygenase SsuD/methylene tetrahydromethanopterin reductase-like flavin-dependent oxidoreductase (luciferase family)